MNKHADKEKTDFIHGESFQWGIMVRNNTNMAITIRKKNGDIVEKIIKRPSLINKNKFLKIPIIKGIIRFVEGAINQFYANQISKEILDKTKTDKQDDDTKEKQLNINKNLAYISVISIIILAVLFYFIGPTLIVYLLKNRIKNTLFLNSIEIILRFLLFLFIFYLVSKTKNSRKSAPYHGAEHKAIYCYKNGERLTMENLRKRSIYHPSCGTNLIITMLIIYIPFILIMNYENLFFRILIILFLLPLILGISFDLVIWAGNNNSRIKKILSFPGLMLQRLNTAEPDDDHLEVAQISFRNILDK